MLNKFFILILLANFAIADEIQQIDSYLNSLKDVTADFIQTDDQDNQQKGKFFLSRPGKMRWQYEFPKKLLLIINNDKLIYFDQQLDQVSYFKNKDDFLALLAQPKIDFSSSKIIVDKPLRRGKVVCLTLHKKDYPGKIVLMFNKSITSLIGLEIIDEANQKVNIEFSNFKKTESLDKRLFTFHSHKNQNPNR